MKTIKLLAIVAFSMMLIRCGTTENTIDTNQQSLLEVVSILDSTKIKFLEYANYTNSDLKRSMELTEYWLSQHPNVKSVYSLDDSYISILLKSGLKTTFYFNSIDDKGNSIYRGGNGKGIINTGTELIRNSNEVLSKNILKNRKVLLFQVDTEGLELEPQIKVISDLITNSGMDIEVTVLRDEQCTIEAFESFKDYGLVIIDGHGMTSAILLGKEINLGNVPKDESSIKNEINTQLSSNDIDKINNGKIELAKSIKGNLSKSDWVKSVQDDGIISTWLTGKHLSTLPQMPNTIIFGNMCFSGWILTSFDIPEKKGIGVDQKEYIIPARTQTFENPIGKTFIEKNLISYYGYTRDAFSFLNRIVPAGTSRSVENGYSKNMEMFFVTRLFKDKDSTKIVHLGTDNKTEYFMPAYLPDLPGELYFRHYGADDYSYSNCKGEFKDDRDGIIYQYVCMGKQIWMAENLRYNAPGSVFYDDNPANGPIYGKLYDWATVMNGAGKTNANPSGVQGICPKGWHVPSSAEWEYMNLVITGNRGGDLKDKNLWKAPNLGATNLYGFSARGGGFSKTDGKYEQLNIFGWWTTTNGLNQGIEAFQLQSWTIPLLKINVGFTYKISCRCVKD